MIEKKIHSDNPELSKHIHGKDEDNDGLSKSFDVPQQDPPKEEKQPEGQLSENKQQEEVKQEEVKQEEVKQEEIKTETPQVEMPAEPDMKIAVFLIECFGKESFERLRHDGNFLVPFTDETTDLATWLAQSVRMLFKPGETENMSAAMLRWLDKQKEIFADIEKELAAAKEKLEESQQRQKQLENDYILSDTERQQLRHELQSSISAVYMIDRFLPRSSSPIAKKLGGMLKEEMTHPTEDYAGFITGFLEGWQLVSEALDNTTDDEAGMESVHLALTDLLEKISEKTITQRRPILEVIAGHCSEKFKLYKFISPEESLQVDPRIHSATALGGSTIKEGITFAVIKKDTMQTVKYAEIKV
jgi:hypothetical protein